MLCQHFHQLDCLLQFLAARPSAAENAPSSTAAAATRQNRQQDDEGDGDDEWKQPPELLDEIDDTLNETALSSCKPFKIRSLLPDSESDEEEEIVDEGEEADASDSDEA